MRTARISGLSTPLPSFASALRAQLRMTGQRGENDEQQADDEQAGLPAEAPRGDPGGLELAGLPAIAPRGAAGEARRRE